MPIIRELIERIRVMPAMYLGRWSLTACIQFIEGYIFALQQKLPNEPDDHESYRQFHAWISYEYHGEMTTLRGSDWILLYCVNDERAALEKFFALFDEYTQTFGWPEKLTLPKRDG